MIGGPLSVVSNSSCKIEFRNSLLSEPPLTSPVSEPSMAGSYSASEPAKRLRTLSLMTLSVFSLWSLPLLGCPGFGVRFAFFQADTFPSISGSISRALFGAG